MTRYLAFARDKERWIETPNEAVRFTDRGRDVWVRVVTDQLDKVWEVEGLGDTYRTALEKIEPSVGGVDRYLFIPSLPGLVVVEVFHFPVYPEWQDELRASVIHDVNLRGEVEITDLDMEPLQDVFSASRADQREDGRVLLSRVLVGSDGSNVFVMRGKTANVIALAEFDLHARDAFASLEVREDITV